MRRAWPRIQTISNGIELFLAIDRQVRSLGQILTQQAVGVLTGAPLPGTMRVAEVDAHAGVGRQFGMAGHFLSLVIGQALAQRRTDGIELGCEGCQCRGSSGTFHARQQHQTAGALNEHADRGLVAGTLDEIAFPVARHDGVSDFRWAHVDADHVRDLTTAVHATTAWQARAVAMTQAGDEFAAEFTPSMGIDDGINRSVGHVELALMRKDPLERSRYPLRRPLPAEHRTHHASSTHTSPMQLAVAAGIAPASDRTQLRMVGTIALPSTGVAAISRAMVDGARSKVWAMARTLKPRCLMVAMVIRSSG
jgi:hypothetical protein